MTDEQVERLDAPNQQVVRPDGSGPADEGGGGGGRELGEQTPPVERPGERREPEPKQPEPRETPEAEPPPPKAKKPRGGRG